MERTARVVILAGLLLFAVPARGVRASGYAVTAKAAILIDNQTGEVLWERNPDVPLPPASTTKIVTAMVALQSGRLDDSLRVTSEAAQAPPSKISLRPGWRMRVRDLVYAILLNSANDASVVIAEGLSGSVQNFAQRMNVQARALGATHTHFVNPNGLPADDHYSTARDLATIFTHALRNPLFEQIVGTKTVVVAPTSGSSRHIVLRSHNRLLDNYRIHVVGKTGYTIAAKKCFVGAGTADGRELVVAVLGSRDLWGDVKRLLEYGITGANPPPPDAPAVGMVSANVRSSRGGEGRRVGSVHARRTRRYSVRLATFGKLSRAKRLKNEVARSGYRARVETVRTDRGQRYHVSVGSYPSRQEAQAVAAALKRSHREIKTAIVASG
jgi:D-alanyl-D-alanine carboxypeptidase (penicillin-binding protein 5/6)